MLLVRANKRRCGIRQLEMSAELESGGKNSRLLGADVTRLSRCKADDYVSRGSAF